MRRKTYFSLASLLLLSISLISCSSASTIPSTTRSTTATSGSTTIVTPTPFGGESAHLGPVPQDCPFSPQPQNIAPDQFGPAIGSDPVWAGAGNFSKLPTTPALITTSQIAQRTHQPEGWNFKFLWVIAANYKGQVIISGKNLKDEAALQYNVPYSAAASTATTLILNTQTPNLPNRTDRWTEFPGGLLVPEAGCYILNVVWSGGSWQRTFAVGVGASSSKQ